MKKFFQKNWYAISVLLIVLLATILRFYNYENRWGLAYDQAHDALIARYAVNNFLLPLLGPFSSAGAFQTGGEWYWIIMIGTVLFPFSIMGPWIFITFLYVIFTILIIWVAKLLVDKIFSLIVGVLTAISTAQIAQGVSLTNQSPEAFFSLLALLFSVLFIRTKKRKYLFCLALFVSTAASIHLQGAALIVLVVITFVFAGLPRKYDVLVVLLGLFIPWMPVMIVDIQNHFYNSKNMLNYYFHEQYKISLEVLGRRWLTYLGIFWPKMWSYVVGGNIIFGYILGIALFFFSLFKLWKKTLAKEWIIILLSLVGMIVIMRYTRTPLFESYIVFLHPFILLLSGWIIYNIYKNQKIIGIFIFIIIIVFSLQRSIKEVTFAGNSIVESSRQLRADIIKKFPRTKYAVYDQQNKTRSVSFPLVLFLDEQHLNADSGKKIGISLNKAKSQYIAIDLTRKSTIELKKEGWYLVTAKKVFLSTEEWYKRDTSY